MTAPITLRAREIVAGYYQVQLDAASSTISAGGSILRRTIDRVLAGKEDDWCEVQIAIAAIRSCEIEGGIDCGSRSSVVLAILP